MVSFVHIALASSLLFFTSVYGSLIVNILDSASWTSSQRELVLLPADLLVEVESGSDVDVSWHEPLSADNDVDADADNHTGFKLRVVPLSEAGAAVRVVIADRNETSFRLTDLTPGASYELQLSVFYGGAAEDVDQRFVATNFTTKPNVPEGLVLWVRNETALLVLCQPPKPPGIFTHYKVWISPQDAKSNELLVVKKDGVDSNPWPSDPAAFVGLSSGRAYTVWAAAVSADQTSEPITAHFRTAPRKPLNISVDETTLGTDFFDVTWSAPIEATEFDHYQLTLGPHQESTSVGKDAPLRVRFTGNVGPGHSYVVVVKTVSGDVVSAPVTVNATTRPFPVQDNIEIHSVSDGETEEQAVVWAPHPKSVQDKYKISFGVLDLPSSSSITSVVVDKPFLPVSRLHATLPPDAANAPNVSYAVSILAMSQGVASYKERSVIVTCDREVNRCYILRPTQT